MIVQNRERFGRVSRNRGSAPFARVRSVGGIGGSVETPPLSFGLRAQTSLVPENTIGSGTPTFTANSTRYQEDFESKLNLVLANEARFQGARRVQNRVTGTSENFASAANWVPVAGGSGSVPVVSTGFTDPLGGTTAYRVQATIGAGVAGSDYNGLRNTKTGNLSVGSPRSIWAKSNTGATQTFMLLAATGEQLVTATTSWQRVSAAAVGAFNLMDAVGLVGNGGTDKTVDVLIWRAQMEDTQGQANTNPSEYVSVGVLSAPYHGAGVDGVKYFSTLNGNTVASNVVTEATGSPINSSTSKFGVLPGNSSSYFSSPHSAVATISGSVDIRAYISAATAGVAQTIVAKKAAGNGYSVYVDTNNKLNFLFTGTNGTTLTSTVAMPYINGVGGWIRFTLDSATGNGKFYTSSNGTTWTQLGTDSNAAGATAITDAGVALNVGGFGTTGQWLGSIYRVQIYNGINGTLAVDFNPNLSTSAQTFTAATGEVWTTNGTARIYGNTHATYGIPAQWDAGGPFGYLAEGARADVLGVTAAIRRTMTDVGWVVGATMTVGSATGVDGVASAGASLTGGAVTATNTILFTTVMGSAARTYGAWVRRKTGTGVIEMTDNGGTNWTAITSSLNTSTYVLVQVTRTQANPIVGFRITTNTDAIEVDFNTIEAASFANPTPIPVNVSKAADVLTYASAGNVNGTQGSVYGEMFVPASGLFGSIVDLDSAGNRPVGFNGGVGAFAIFDGTTVVSGGPTLVNGALNKGAAYWGGTSMGVVLGGVAGTAGAFDGNMNVGASFLVGARTGSPLDGTIRNVRIYSAAMSSSALMGMTS